jgi:tight adherence protein B
MSATARGLALLAGVLAGPPTMVLLARAARPAARALDTALACTSGIVQATLVPLRLAASHGRDPSAAERRRLQAAGVLGGALAGWIVGGVALALVAAAAAAFALPRLATWRRLRYARRVEAGAADAAQAMASALAGGGSIRAAVGVAAGELTGPIAVELRRTAVELDAGARVDRALDGLVARAPSSSIMLIAAAIQLQRRSGGDLAAFLRRLAASLEDERRATAEAYAATAQARVTATIVMALPPAGMVLAELASPGLVGRMFGSPVGAMLVVVASGLQVAGAVIVRRLARVGT